MNLFTDPDKKPGLPELIRAFSDYTYGSQERLMDENKNLKMEVSFLWGIIDEIEKANQLNYDAWFAWDEITKILEKAREFEKNDTTKNEN